jgi:hypothetical protein
MINDSTARILWITDIHFNSLYTELIEKEQLDKYIDRFVQYAGECHQAKPFSYVFITGDLAQMGKSDDYQAFQFMLLGKLLDRFLQLKSDRQIALPLVVPIPGNHDVKWSNSTFLRDYLDKIDPGAFRFKDRASFLSSRPDDFSNLFSDYSVYIKNLATHDDFKKYHEFFDFNHDTTVIKASESYLDGYLYGYIIDKRRSLIIVLMNSAWYSLGSNFNTMLTIKELFGEEMITKPAAYLEWKGKNPTDYNTMKDYFNGVSVVEPATGIYLHKEPTPAAIREIYEHLFNILEKKDVISEYNNQVSGSLLLKLDEWRAVFDDYKDFTVVTCMHHPLNWLEWNEQYSYEQVGATGVLREILQFSDLFLTGHEHVPPDSSRETISAGAVHLKGGCFLNDKQHENINFEHNWFSILSIDSLRGIALQKKVIYSESRGWEPLHEKDDMILLDKKNQAFVLTPEREQEVRSMLSAFSNDSARQYLLRKEVLLPGEAAGLVPINESIFARAFHYRDAKTMRLFLMATVPNFYRTANTSLFYDVIDNVLKGDNTPIKKIVFLVPDFFVDDHLMEQYRTGKVRRDMVRDRIFKQSDIDFDHFRTDFFLRFEPTKPSEPTDPELLNVLRSYKDLQLVNHVIPYYELHPYL